MKLRWFCAPGLVVLASCSAEPGAPARSPAPAVATGAAPSPAKAGAAPRQDASLTPRNVFFANPDRARVTLSPDGKHIAFLANNEQSVLNVFVAPVADPAKGKAVTQEKTRNLRMYAWAFDSRHILYQQDEGGDENWRVHAVDVTTGKLTPLVALPGVQARVEAISHRRPGEIVVALNDRDKKSHDLHVVSLKTGQRKLLSQNDAGYAGYVVDDDLAVRFALKSQPDGSEALLRAEKKGDFKPFLTIPMEDTLTTSPVDFDATGQRLFMKDSRGRNTGALVELDLAKGAQRLIAEDQRADIGDVLVHPTRKHVQAVQSVFDRARWNVIDKTLAPDFAQLKTVADGDFSIPSRSLDDKQWIVAYVTEGPTKYYRYDRSQKPPRATFLFSSSQALESAKLAKMQPVVIKARDGLNLVSYLTVPDGTGRPGPMVLLVHGGPWARDFWGFNPTAQWLASRGYAVLQVNYRGSTGFGKAFVNAANREWAGKMHDDLLDAVAWTVAQKIADPAKVAIMGGSYGGYATLVGLTFTPDRFACGVDIVGPSNLVTLLNTVPPYWTPVIEQFTRRIGDHRTDAGRKFLMSRSPLSRVNAIQRPLLIAQGKNDPRVKQAEADQIVSAMQGKHIPVTYVLYPDEGHGFNRAENRLSFYAISEIFLAQCLGGTYQTIGQDFQAASLNVLAGKDHIHSLGKALP
jgi:dipeptidyl aminopeptidase/acylaminoacyl peptidase